MSGLGARRAGGLLLCAVLVLSSNVFQRAQASAWTQPKGRWQVISKLTFYRSNGGFDNQGQPVPTARFERRSLETYVEYGLARGLTIGIEPRYELVTSGFGSHR